MKYLVEDCDNPADPVQDYAEAKKVVRRILGSHPTVKRAAMFGSFVRGEQKGSSDVDLLIETDGKDASEIIDIGFDLVEKLGREVDMLTTLRGAQSGFVENLKREGLLIYRRD